MGMEASFCQLDTGYNGGSIQCPWNPKLFAKMRASRDDVLEFLLTVLGNVETLDSREAIIRKMSFCAKVPLLPTFLQIRFLTGNVYKAKSQHEQLEREGPRTTPREIEIIRLLAEGKSNKEIAVLLGITVSTVETHRSHIMLKLGLHSLAELIHYAMRHGLVQAPSQP